MFLPSIITTIFWFMDHIHVGLHKHVVIIFLGTNNPNMFGLHREPQIIFTNSPLPLNWMLKSGLMLTLRSVVLESYNIQKIFITCSDLLKFFEKVDCDFSWRTQHLLPEIHHLLINVGSPKIIYKPRKWNRVASLLSGHGVCKVILSLFNCGLDKARWFMRIIEQASFTFNCIF